MFLIPSHIRKTLGSVLTDHPHDGPHTALILLPHGQVLCSVNNGDEDWMGESGSGSGSVSGQQAGGAGSLTGDDQEEDDDEDDEDQDEKQGDDSDDDDDDEPYIPTPERNRMLRGIVNTQLLESNAFPFRPSQGGGGGGGGGGGKKRSSLKIECELGRILAYPLSLPIPIPSSSSTTNTPSTYTPTNFSHPDPRLRHLTSTPNLSPQSLTYTLSALGLDDATADGQEVALAGGKREGILVLVLNGTRDLDWEHLESAAKTFEKEFRTTLSSGA